jgi:hypothetical protein
MSLVVGASVRVATYCDARASERSKRETCDLRDFSGSLFGAQLTILIGRENR